MHAIVAKAATVDENAGPMARALRPVADALKSNAKVFEKTLVKERGKLRHFVSERGDVGEREGERTQKSRDDERRVAIGSESGRIRRGE